jgi:hypothetical protein
MGGLHLTTHQHELINPTSFIPLVKNNKSTISNYLVIKMLMALTSLGLTNILHGNIFCYKEDCATCWVKYFFFIYKVLEEDKISLSNLAIT